MPVIIFFSLIILFGITVKVFFSFAPQVGGKVKGERLKKIRESANYKDNRFHNPVQTNMDMTFSTMLKIAGKMLSAGSTNEPGDVIQTIPFDKEKFNKFPEDDLVITWFGHSSLLIKMEGLVFLIDPVFSERASMFSFIGPKRFNYSNYVKVEELPPLDAIILTHDHYDHLDYETMSKLKGKVNKFFVPLGVGAHLEHWGYSAKLIQEMDWWESINVTENLELICTPARHFSGRGFTRFETLWCSWVLAGQKQKIYLGGDSGYYPGFRQIGDKYGPFDIAFIESGAYNENWKEIHIFPEDAVQAHLDLKGSVLMPIHWGKFNLAMHHWKEPVQRLLKTASKKKVKVVTPEIGQVFSLNKELPDGKWWEKYD
jgi:L-ascorbate metabolism protein UlaG (beta-lactamase superfamily)